MIFTQFCSLNVFFTENKETGNAKWRNFNYFLEPNLTIATVTIATLRITIDDYYDDCYLERSKKFIVKVEELWCYPRRPEHVGQSQGVDDVDEQEAQVPEEDVQGTQEDTGPNAEKTHGQGEATAHQQGGGTEVVGNQEGHEVKQIANLKRN